MMCVMQHGYGCHEQSGKYQEYVPAEWSPVNGDLLVFSRFTEPVKDLQQFHITDMKRLVRTTSNLT